jgi:hypothetical protein
VDEKEDFCFEATPYRVDGFGNHLLFGYPPFGGWFPYAGFSSLSEYDDIFKPTAKITVRFFRVEWFLRGLIWDYRIEIQPMFEDRDG